MEGKKTHPGYELLSKGFFFGCFYVGGYSGGYSSLFLLQHTSYLLYLFLLRNARKGGCEITSPPNASFNREGIPLRAPREPAPCSSPNESLQESQSKLLQKSTDSSAKKHLTTTYRGIDVENPSQQAWPSDLNVYQTSRQVNNRAPFKSDHQSSLHCTGMEMEKIPQAFAKG